MSTRGRHPLPYHAAIPLLVALTLSADAPAAAVTYTDIVAGLPGVSNGSVAGGVPSLVEKGSGVDSRC